MRTVAPRPGSHRIPSLSEILHLPPVATRLPPPGRTVIPPGICHRLSENSSSLFERGLRGKNKEGSVKSALKSPHDASAGRVPGQFPQRVKRGRKGSRRTDVKLSLQCQKEEAATRHKITKSWYKIPRILPQVSPNAAAVCALLLPDTFPIIITL